MPIPRSLCPRCGYLNGEHVYPAIDNNIMMCLNCGATTRFDPEFRLVLTTEEDMSKLNIYQLKIIEAMLKHIIERGPIMQQEKPS